VQGWLVQRLHDTSLGSQLAQLMRQQTRFLWTPLGLLVRMLLSGVVLAALLIQTELIAGGWFPSLLLGLVLGGYLPLWMVLHARSRRLREIENQLPDTLDYIERAMRAGHAFSSAIQMAGEETSEPLAREFRVVFEQINYGVSMDDALKALAQRIPNSHINYFVVSVLIQRDTGGNLSELLRHISHAVRERIRFAGELRVLSSEGRLSGWVLTLLPFGIGTVLYLINPKFMNRLIEDPAGPTILGTTAALMVVGILWMRRIVRVDY
jgi:tight adherence protein B